MEGHPAHLATRGWDVTLVTGGPRSKVEGAASVIIPMRRDPSPLADVLALLRWTVFLRKALPGSIMVGTPKAGFLGILAGWLTRVPRRTYLLRGLRLEGTTGHYRALLWVIEWLTCTLSTDVVAVSPSLAEKVVELRLARAPKVHVLGSGSSNGVDLTRFDFPTEQHVRASRSRLGISEDAFVVGYVGRLNKDKGIDTLLAAFESLGASDEVVLLVAGGREDVTLPKYLGPDGDRRRIVALGRVDDPREVYACADLLALPSLREGFPNVVLEAAGMGVPAVVSDATGCRDAVIPDTTGWRVPVGDAHALALAIAEARNKPALRRERGRAARDWVEQKFERRVVWELYDGHLGRPGGEQRR
ncbi:glycosyltransferase family 4 protein [Ornithinimicrobium cryptoxanthini]|uniref:glycosyltransferase family 4 protein n=1 Tax=Ornithinimicrobium cryptoxanthini TaxID=2934161 RepID=UPI00211853FC|nr:glycosyltransferase family 4 protein [Ornithinimicrobium cryptoxanthini]